MADLRELLRYLERDDISALILQTDAATSVEYQGQRRWLGREPLSAADLAALVRGTGLTALIPPRDSDGALTPVELFGARYAARVARRGDLLRFHITLGAAAPASGVSAASLLEETVRVPVVAPAPSSPLSSPHSALSSPHGAALELDDPASALEDDDELSLDLAEAPPVASSSLWLERPSGLEQALAFAREHGASDLHITSDRPIQIRRVGQLIPVSDPIPHGDVERWLLPSAGAHQAALSELGYADFSLELERGGRVRANLCRHRAGLKGCYRLVMNEPPSIEQLGLPPEVMRITGQHQGLVVVAGPNGQGKSTTMAALVDWFNENKSVHIITVEDPIEIRHPVKRALVSQREVGSHTASFYTALKGSLREDPDVIAIGELRDRETVEMALSAAETGHLVLATMSTPSGAKTIDRLIELFPPDDQAQVRATMAGALKFVLSQRLVPTLDGEGMVAAVELITGNVPLWKLIRDNKLFQLPSLLQRGRSYGMLRIEDSLSDLVRAGKISADVARAFADDPRAVDGAARSAAAAPEPDAPRADAGRRGLKGLFGRKEG
ncbi:MAG: PilT/PilU family type 4a pilus ATPase [Polyangiaceae bacterium]|nr:PilT/PilU family type 4a pilus ATPase [Polyangiaceae bacterium]MCW5789448.1 PilT/PilU family type 4a pilus ATPase [Polyangiaceae bacterium]